MELSEINEINYILKNSKQKKKKKKLKTFSEDSDGSNNEETQNSNQKEEKQISTIQELITKVDYLINKSDESSDGSEELDIIPDNKNKKEKQQNKIKQKNNKNSENSSSEQNSSEDQEFQNEDFIKQYQEQRITKMPSYARYPAKDQRFASLSIYKPKKVSSSSLLAEHVSHLRSKTIVSSSLFEVLIKPFFYKTLKGVFFWKINFFGN